MSSCDRSVTTATGTFTFRNELLTKCQAKEACLRDGQILASVTSSRDLQALNDLAGSYDGGCGIGFYTYHIGLDVKKCGEVETRLFTNNVLYDKSEHDRLYEWHGDPTKDINVAIYYPMFKKMYIVKSSHGKGKRKFVCLKPNSTSGHSARLLSEEGNRHNFSLLMATVAVMVALVSIVLVLKFKKESDFEKNANEKLKNRNETLKREIERLKK